MKVVIRLAAFSFLLVTIASSQAFAGANSPSIKANGNTGPVAGLSWRCGKKNPASWGTFGNGCLKQKRNWGKKKSPTNGVLTSQ